MNKIYLIFVIILIYTILLEYQIINTNNEIIYKRFDYFSLFPGFFNQKRLKKSNEKKTDIEPHYNNILIPNSNIIIVNDDVNCYITIISLNKFTTYKLNKNLLNK